MPPILLIHGFPYDSSMWHHQAETLRAQGHLVFTPNLPGFGPTLRSFPPQPAQDENTAIDAYANRIHNHIEQLHVPAIVAGFSMGGYTLLSLLRNHPSDVAAAIFIDTRADADTEEARANRFTSIKALEAGNKNQVLEGMLDKQLTKAAPPKIREEARAIMQRQPVSAIIAAQKAMAARPDQTSLLPTLKIPTLFLVGAEDAITPPPIAQAMQQKVPHSHLTIIPGAGHLSPLEQPTAVTHALTTFIPQLKK